MRSQTLGARITVPVTSDALLGPKFFLLSTVNDDFSNHRKRLCVLFLGCPTFPSITVQVPNSRSMATEGSNVRWYRRPGTYVCCDIP